MSTLRVEAPEEVQSVRTATIFTAATFTTRFDAFEGRAAPNGRQGGLRLGIHQNPSATALLEFRERDFHQTLDRRRLKGMPRLASEWVAVAFAVLLPLALCLLTHTRKYFYLC